MQIDVAAYLARIGLPAPPASDAAGLARLHRAHRLAIPLEAFEVALGRGISLDPHAVFDKLVTRRRGGYGFEHNALFLRALGAIGFTARPLLARVWLDASEPGPLVHALALVRLADGAEWIADAGSDAAYAPPLPLVDGATAATPDGARHRLGRHPEHGWMLWRAGAPAASDGRGAGAHDEHGLPQISFTTAHVWPADVALGNHWAATAPSSRFVRHRIAGIVLPTGFAALTDRRYSRATATDHIAAEITSARAYRLRLSLVFGIDLTADEVTALGLFEAA